MHSFMSCCHNQNACLSLSVLTRVSCWYDIKLHILTIKFQFSPRDEQEAPVMNTRNATKRVGAIMA